MRPAASTVFPNLALRVKQLPTPVLHTVPLMLSVKQGSCEYQFLRHCFDPTRNHTRVYKSIIHTFYPLGHQTDARPRCQKNCQELTVEDLQSNAVYFLGKKLKTLVLLSAREVWVRFPGRSNRSMARHRRNILVLTRRESAEMDLATRYTLRHNTTSLMKI